MAKYSLNNSFQLCAEEYPGEVSLVRSVNYTDLNDGVLKLIRCVFLKVNSILIKHNKTKDSNVKGTQMICMKVTHLTLKNTRFP